MAENTPIAPPFVIHKEYIKDLSFEMPGAPKIFFENNIAVNSEINININAGKINENLFSLNLHVEINNKNKDDPLFLVDITYSAVCTINKEGEEEQKRTLLVDIPYIIFPSVAAIIANITRDSGFPPLILAPVDFAKMFKNSPAAKEISKEN